MRVMEANCLMRSGMTLVIVGTSLCLYIHRTKKCGAARNSSFSNKFVLRPRFMKFHEPA